MSESNPYAAPSADMSRNEIGEFKVTGPKSRGIGRGWGWISDGFVYFKNSPGPWILTLIVGAIVFILMSFVPIIGQIALMATYYVWFGGIMRGCHEQDRTGRFKLAHLFASFKNPGKLIILSVLMSVLSALIMVVAVGPIYLEFFGNTDPSPEMLEALADPVGFWLPFLFGMLAMIPIMMAAWFAPALIEINNVSLPEAVRLSFVGCLKNMLPLTVYGIIAMVLYILGAIPLLLGLLIVFPTLLASMYTSYKDIFID